MSAAPAAFGRDERAKIAELLGLAGDQVRAAEWVNWLEAEVLYHREFDRRADDMWRQYFHDVHDPQTSRRRRGRPPSMLAARGYELLQAAAAAYVRCTGKQPANSREGAFYQLAQICTRLEDPAPLIARLPKPFSDQQPIDSTPMPG